ncbi:S9 family peptidase [Fictibacillus sp. WQ 8-8]|uniref:S9 family peptidase n=1 Tax=Fictibacillus sp. WQ 8-8 TaxID=2938788 RepID=UPI00210B9271|nr:S9 family peptidase [Fictibacillus sp. WQ 8-8]MCQ6265893.1 S9 family peptidase [Fictibacillus sp. WQ 8-8]
MKRPLNPEDLFELKIVSDPQISPDGKSIVYVETKMDRDTNKYSSRIWIVSTSGETAPQQFTSGPGLDFAPRWSPDGKWLAFVSTRRGHSQLWIMSSTGGEAEALTSIRYVGSIPVWSPDSRTIGCVVHVGPEGPEDDIGRKRTPRQRFSEDVLVIDRLEYKLDTTGYLVGKHWHLFTIPVVGPDRGKFQQLTFGDYNYSSPAWSPDGQYIAVAGNRTPDRLALALVNDIWVIAATGGEPHRLTRSQGPANHPTWSPDGQVIAYVGHDRRYGGYTNPGIWMVAASGGEPWELTNGFPYPIGDKSIGDIRGHKEPSISLTWAPDGQNIYTCVSKAGAVHLWRFSIPDNQAIQMTTGNSVIYNVSFTLDTRQVAMAITTATLPNDIWVADISKGTITNKRRLTRVNRDWLSQLAISEPIHFSSRSANGPEVEGWILYPPGGIPARSLIPTILEIHGGPMIMYGYVFFLEFQLLASQGFAVIYTNPRGSMGYGQEFVAAIRGDWGNHDYMDLMAAMDYVLSKGTLDPNRLGVAGGSYGGYMTNWIVTQTHRFKAAVSMRGISNLYSLFGTSDCGFLKADDYGGPPWVFPEKYMKRSPIKYVANVRTPLLIIQSTLDFRVPIEQGEQFYTALKFQGRNVRMIRFLNDTHELSRSGNPWHRVIRLEHILSWFQKHLKLTTGTNNE